MVISRVIIRVTPFRALITLLITYLLSPLPLQVRVKAPSSKGSGPFDPFPSRTTGKSACTRTSGASKPRGIAELRV